MAGGDHTRDHSRSSEHCLHRADTHFPIRRDSWALWKGRSPPLGNWSVSLSMVGAAFIPKRGIHRGRHEGGLGNFTRGALATSRRLCRCMETGPTSLQRVETRQSNTLPRRPPASWGKGASLEHGGRRPRWRSASSTQLRRPPHSALLLGGCSCNTGASSPAVGRAALPHASPYSPDLRFGVLELKAHGLGDAIRLRV